MQSAPVWNTSLLWILLVAGLPVLVWLDRFQLSLIQGRRGVLRIAPPRLDGRALLQGAIEAYRRLVWPGEDSTSSELAWSRVWVPSLRTFLLLLALAAVPWGTSYALSGGEFRLVVADLEYAAAYVVGIAALAALVSAVEAWGAGSGPDAGAALRSSAQTLAGHAALFASLLAMLLIYGTLDLGETVLAQQSSLRALGFLQAVWPAAAESAWVDSLRIPAWGIVLQPLAFALFLVSALAWAGGAGIGDPRAGEGSGAPADPLRLDRRVQDLLMASLATCVFLGGWSLPWISDIRLLAAWTPVLGGELAQFALLLLHLLLFGLKVVSLLGLFTWVRVAGPFSRLERVLGFGWRRLFPLSLANLVLTAAGIAALGAGR
ncbi:MAG: NADH-quinone oxidoreductase subunit H [Proteobacteria bacterium]|nr:NADH-quinone oxidoreductase subunit H [Pseudomonadota bacterium]